MSDAHRIIKGYPPNVEAIEARFGDVVRGKTVHFCYAPYVYVPSGKTLSPPLEAHERVHLEQQGDDPVTWWERYIEDDDFRFAQELPAHRAEWRKWKAKCRDREILTRALRRISVRLASPLYGSMMTRKAARRAILQREDFARG